MAQPAPGGALGPRAKVSGKVDTQLGSRGSGKNGGDGREGTLSGSFLSGLWGPSLPMRKGPGRPVGSSLFCLRAAYQLPAILSRCLFCFLHFGQRPICLTHIPSCCSLSLFHTLPDGK